MSGSIALSSISNALQAVASILIRVPRMIQTPNAFIIPDAVVEETSRDDLQITEHPVEIGSTISDHAYAKPREVTLRWAWSNSGRYETFMQDVFATLKSIQTARQPMNIYTGKCAYQNMLVASLGVTTNTSSEYSLQSVMVCREVIIVSTQAVQVPQSAQSTPQTTAGIAGAGTQQPVQQTAGFGDSTLATSTQVLLQ
jgi:hypothetical protein